MQPLPRTKFLTDPAGLLAATPMAAFAWSGGQSSANPATSNQAIDQTAPSGPASGQQNQQLSQNTVAEMQQKLQQDGFYKSGRVDGRMGPRTEHALRNFQQAKGLTASGQPDRQTMAALGVNQQPNGGPESGTANNG